MMKNTPLIGRRRVLAGVAALACALPPRAFAATQNDLGALSPQAALRDMQQTKNLLIVDVATEKWYRQQHFPGAVNIPIEDLDAAQADRLYQALPADRPVLLHCRLGMIVPQAYRRLKALRPDIPEIAYIDCAPPFDAYNEWYAAP